MNDLEQPWLDALGHASAYPEGVDAGDAIQRIDTHISHVFLAGPRVYKLRRPVHLAFLDFSSAEERLADCLREVALNRRLAPDVYLGIAPVLVGGGEVRIGPVGERASDDPHAVEHCVVMRRLEKGRDLRSLIEREAVTPSQIDRIATSLATFHASHSLGRPAPVASDEWLSRTTAPARANFDAVAAAPASLVPPGEVVEIRRRAAEFVEKRRADFEARRANGRVVDGHGDLHAEHVWFETDGAEPLMVDCLEFRDDFRCIDAASDAAFLAMDLAYRGRSDLGDRFLRRYARDAGDYHLFAVVDYFLSYRALVRAKVASLVATDASLPAAQREHASDSVRRHLDLGLEFLEGRGRAAVIVTCGTIGTGKTTVAEALADATGAVVISSDRLRRSMRDAAPEESYSAGRYSSDSRAAVYERLLAEAAHVVSSGRTAILDATYSKRAWRQAAFDWARANGCNASLVEVVAPREAVLERLAERKRAGNDASEAGPGLYDAMRAEFEAPDEWPADRRAQLDTSREDWKERVREIAQAFG